MLDRTDRACVMPAAKNELGRAIPDGDDDLVALPERL